MLKLLLEVLAVEILGTPDKQGQLVHLIKELLEERDHQMLIQNLEVAAVAQLSLGQLELVMIYLLVTEETV